MSAMVSLDREHGPLLEVGWLMQQPPLQHL